MFFSWVLHSFYQGQNSVHLRICPEAHTDAYRAPKSYEDEMETNLIHSFSSLELADVCLFLPYAINSLTSVLRTVTDSCCLLKLIFVFSLLFSLFCIGILHLLMTKKRYCLHLCLEV